MAEANLAQQTNPKLLSNVYTRSLRAASSRNGSNLQDFQIMSQYKAIPLDGVDEDELKAVGKQDMAITPAQHNVSVSFQDVSYTITKWTLRGRKVFTLLDDVSGYLKSGSMTALMGPSGCGKTTLLDVLAMRKTQGQISGNVLFNGAVPTRVFMRRSTGYCEQQDTLISTLSPAEMLMYTACLKLPRSVSKLEKLQRVSELIDLLGLQTCKSTRIGSTMRRGISGGQARRVSLGIALVTKPQVLFLDEMTSGLDARTSDQILDVVRNLCLQEQVTVCATIHTPTSYSFKQFDRVMLMARGSLLYFGPNDGTAITFFTSIGYQPRPGDSTAEALIDLVTAVQDDNGNGAAARQFAKTGTALDNMRAIKQLSEPLTEDPLRTQGVRAGKATMTPSWYAAAVFLRYRTLRNYKSLAWLGPRVIPTILFTSLMALLYQGQGAQAGLMQLVNISALNFMSVVIPQFASVAFTPTISLERNLFYRERNDGLYRTATYLFCKLVEELAIMLPYTAGVSALVFFVVQLQGSFMVYWLVFLVANAISVAFAYLVTAAAPSLDIANAVVPAVNMVMLFFAGFLILKSAIPAGLQWLVYVNPMKYGFTALQYNQWSSSDEVIIDFDKFTDTIANRTATYVASLPDRLNIPILSTPPSPSPALAAPRPGGIGGIVTGIAGNIWDDITGSLRNTVRNATGEATEAVMERVLGFGTDTLLRTLNSTINNVTNSVMENIRGAQLPRGLTVSNLSDLTWGQAILAVTSSGEPYNPWVNIVIQAGFFVFFTIAAFFAMAFVQHQHR